MSYPIYVQQEHQVPRPFQYQMEALPQYQQYYLQNQYSQPQQLLVQRVPVDYYPMYNQNQQSHQMGVGMSNMVTNQMQMMTQMPSGSPSTQLLPASTPSNLNSAQSSHANTNASISPANGSAPASNSGNGPYSPNFKVYPSLSYQSSVVAPNMQQSAMSSHPLLPNDRFDDHKLANSIDYTSLVGYTISNGGRRRRRTETKNVDVGGAKHTCEACGKVFQKPYNLKLHMKTHSTDRPFKCRICDKRFARAHDRKRHELLHEGVKNFKCEGYLKSGNTRWGCGKQFARLDALARHFRTETGWLCIKPLMDEAKELEMAGKLHPEHPLYFQHQIALPPLRHLH